MTTVGVEAKEIYVRDMKRKWASASSRGRLTFDRTLLTRPADKRAEVIVHELVHLKIGNRGPLFRSLARAYLAGRSGPVPQGAGERGARSRRIAEGSNG